MLGGAVALGREQDAPAGAGHGALEEVDVGLLAGLEHAELGVDRGVLGDDPARPGPRAVLGAVPGGPAVAGGRAVDVGPGAAVELVGSGGCGGRWRWTGSSSSKRRRRRRGGIGVAVVLAQRGVSRGGVPAGRAEHGGCGGIRRAERGDGCGHVPDGGRHVAAPRFPPAPRLVGAQHGGPTGAPDNRVSRTPPGVHAPRQAGTTTRGAPARRAPPASRRGAATAATPAASAGSARVTASTRASRPLCALLKWLTTARLPVGALGQHVHRDRAGHPAERRVRPRPQVHHRLARRRSAASTGSSSGRQRAASVGRPGSAEPADSR